MTVTDTDRATAEALLRECNVSMKGIGSFLDIGTTRSLVAGLVAERRVLREALEGLGLTWLGTAVAFHVGRVGRSACIAHLNKDAYLDNEDICRAIAKVNDALAQLAPRPGGDDGE